MQARGGAVQAPAPAGRCSAGLQRDPPSYNLADTAQAYRIDALPHAGLGSE
jgi:hypothetical protein